MITKDDLILHREQLQEDLLCLFDGHLMVSESLLDDMCDIICKRFGVLFEEVDKIEIIG